MTLKNLLFFVISLTFINICFVDSVFSNSTIVITSENNINELQRLATAIIQGQKNEVVKLLKNGFDRNLLLKKVLVKDYSGRKIQGTPLQLALGAEDLNNAKQPEIAEVVKRALLEMPGGYTEFTAQVREQFPAGWEEKENIRVVKDKRAVTKVFNCILHASPAGDEYKDLERICGVPLQEFRNYLEPKKTIKTGKHFNIQILLDGILLLGNNYDALGGWNSVKGNVYYRKVIGYIERFVPANYAQALSEELIVNGEMKRRFELLDNYGHQVSFYPLDLDATYRLGYDFGVEGGYTHQYLPPLSFGSSFINLIKSKQVELKHWVEDARAY
ncbi:MAG: hypothetical protein H0W64_00985 [Gammaproteobacteria bacterium]|nr:hypothetical protein [Gammaproteobacteria bacterium]